MKNNYFRGALALPAVAFLMYSFSNGNPNALSGSPGDALETCAVCHGGNSNFGASAVITTDIPESGYQLNTKYTITLSSGASNATKHGFQLVAENSSNKKVGVFSGGSDLTFVESGKRALHSFNATGKSTWTIEWTSPSEDEGEVTFYGVVNATNANFSTSGDQVVTGTKKVASAEALGVSDYFASQFGVYPNPASGSTNLELPAHIGQASVSLYNYLGQLVKSQEVTEPISEIDLTSLSAGAYIMSIETVEGSLTKTIVIQ